MRQAPTPMIFAFSPFAPSQMGEGAQRADEGSWQQFGKLTTRIELLAKPCPDS